MSSNRVTEEFKRDAVAQVVDRGYLSTFPCHDFFGLHILQYPMKLLCRLMVLLKLLMSDIPRAFLRSSKGKTPSGFSTKKQRV